MVVTVVDGDVDPGRVVDLIAAWDEITGGDLPAGLQESFLMCAGDAWRIATVWESREALEQMRSTGETPGALMAFRSAGAEPRVMVFEVERHLQA